MHHLQVTFLCCNVVQGDSRDENTNRCQKVDNKDELQKLPRTPYGFEQLSNEKEADDADKYLQGYSYRITQRERDQKKRCINIDNCCGF